MSATCWRWLRLLASGLLCISAARASADVVINEILYHAPDDLDRLQFIELHNTGPARVSLAGWKLGPGVRFEFPDGFAIEPGGFVVICRDAALFRKHFDSEPAGVFEGALHRNGDRVELIDAAGRKVDAVRFRSRPPWPVAPDGGSASLERICPTAAGDRPDNWAPSPLPKGPPKPSGTPGRPNATFSAFPPPTIANVGFEPRSAPPNQPIAVEAEVTGAGAIRSVELLWRAVSTRASPPETATPMMRTTGHRFRGVIPGQSAGTIVRFRVRAVDDRGAVRHYPSENELAPALSALVHEPYRPGKIPLGFIITMMDLDARPPNKFGPPAPDPPPQGNAAYIHVDARTGQAELFDFVGVTVRNGGHKVHFRKDQPFHGMTAINLIFEGADRFVLAESLAYEVYRKAGHAACLTDFVRLEIDGRPMGYQLLVEQPNKSFLRRNGLRTDGNLYKLQWWGRGLVGQHEKKTNIHGSHEDLVNLVTALNRSTGDDQWQVIRKNFDVDQVINYFAVNMLLSHWDGFFNNYFTYHDVHGTGVWTMYPWDQDKTWGFHDGITGYDVFTDMPLTFGMRGDQPPGARGFPAFFGGGPVWWRPPGYFSGPLLANPEFRKRFLARTKSLLETVYAPETMFPLIDALSERLEEEVKYRAQIRQEDPKAAVEHLRRNLESLREHLVKRRAFLLEQAELRGVAPPAGVRP